MFALTHKATLRALPFALLAILLSACQSAQPAMTFIREHTACTAEGYGTPVWSPDGAEIYFTVRSGASSSVWVMNATGGSQRQLIPDAAYPYPSPDGRWIVYVYVAANARGGPPDYNVLDRTSGRFWALNALGGPFSWSEDGERIAFSTLSALKVSMLDVASGLIEPIAPPEPDQTAYAPLWSPDGKYIAFAYDPDGNVSVYRMDPDGSHITRLTRGGGACAGGGTVREIPAAWSPDGAELAYARSCGSDQRLHITGLDGVEVTGRAYLNRSFISVAWSPDGKFILLHVTGSGRGDIYVADTGGTGMHLLRAVAGDPHWSPDSTQIVFVGVDTAGLDQIYSVAPDGSNLTQLTNNPGGGTICLH